MAKTLKRPITLDTANLGSPFEVINNPNEALNSDIFINQPFNVRATATVNIPNLNSVTTISGVTLATGDRVLLTAQTTQTENLIYKYDLATTSLIEDDWASQLIAGNKIAIVYTFQGSLNANTYYKPIAFSPVIGVTSLSWISLDATVTNVPNLSRTGTVDAGSSAIVPGDFIALNSSGFIEKAIANDSTLFRCLGASLTSSSAGQSITYTTRGIITGTFGFISANFNQNLYLSASTAGAYTLTPPSTSAQYQYLIGRVASANSIYVLADDQTFTIVP